MARVTITLEDTEKEALIALAMKERRDPRAQAALLISRELQRRGLLPDEPDRCVDPGFRLQAERG